MDNSILKIYQFKEEVIQKINNSNLPAVIVKLIIKDLLSEVEKIELQQYQEAKTNQEKENLEENGDEKNGL